MSKIEINLVYIDDLGNNNYKNHIKTMRENIKTIVQIANLGISAASRLIGVSRITLRRFIILENDKIGFTTASKLNNFVYNVCLRDDFSIDSFKQDGRGPKLIKPTT